LIEVALVGETVLRPDTFQTFDKFAASTVSLAVIEPPLANASELLEVNMDISNIAWNVVLPQV
jgi:hypothetical protein